MTMLALAADGITDGIGKAFDTLTQTFAGAAAVLLGVACWLLIKQLLKAKDEKNTVVTQMADRLIAQSDETKALVHEHNQYYAALERQTEANTKAIKRVEKTVEAHAMSCPTLDKAKYVTMRGGQGGG